jgi:TetR/AcrR family transcriptional repressor of nem operon
MGRPPKFERDDAIDTVMNEIWQKGFEACSAKALSEKLGITRSSFYNAFGDRESLFVEAMERYFAQSPDRVLADPNEGVSVKVLLTSVFKAACHARATDKAGRGCFVINSVTELCNVNQELGPLLEDAVIGNLHRLEKLLERGVQHGDFPADFDVHANALALKNLLIGINVMSKVIRDEKELWLTAETTLKALGIYSEL